MDPCCVILGSPVFVYQLWRFIEPGLYASEKKGMRFSAFAATFFFASRNVCWGY